MKQFIRNHTGILSVLGIVLVTMPIVLPFFSSGFFTSHDGEWTVVRLADMFRTVKDGQIPARYSSYLNMQYGYPLFNFAYPAPYYVGIIPVMLKIGFVNSIKFLFVLMTILSGVGMFFLSRHLWKSTLAGIFSSVLFLYLPYRMVDLYVRGSLGEVFALGVLPFLFLFFSFLVVRPSLFLTGISAVLLGFFLTSHNILSLLFFPILILFIVVRYHFSKRNSLRYVLTALCLGVGLAAFFVLPALIEKQHILLSMIPIADRSLYFVTPEQLIIPSWGYGVPTDMKQPFTYQLGLAQIAALGITGITVFLTFRKRTKKLSEEPILATALLGIIIVSVIMLFSFTAFLWEHIPLLSEINYPWTLIAPIGFLICLTSGFIFRNKTAVYPAIAILVSAIVLVLPYAHPETFVNHGDDYYMTNMATTTSSQEYTPLWVKELPIQTFDREIEATENAFISDLVSTSRMTSFRIENPSETVVRINTIYYPGWIVTIDGKETEISYTNPKGVMEFSVPSGSHRIEAVFSETPLRKTANIVSLVSLLGIFGSIVFGIRSWKK